MSGSNGATQEEPVTTATGIELPEIALYADFAAEPRSVLTELEGTHDHGAGPVTVTVVNETGPGGGWPEVKLEGTAPALLAFLLKHYTGGELTGPNGALAFIADQVIPA